MRSSTLFFCSGILIWLQAVSADGQPTPTITSQMVDIDGHAIHVSYSPLENRKKGSPVIVFEAGATNSLDVWKNVMPTVAHFAPVVAYDRAGLGQSAWDNKTPTPRHVTERLHQLLKKIGAEPPYLLVGYSWGGPLARYFAGYYPTEIAGIVYVDPSPIVTQSFANVLAPFDSVGAGRAGYDALWNGFTALFKNPSPAVSEETKVMRSLMERDVKDRDLQPVPDVPVVVLVAGKPFPPFMQLPYDQQEHFKVDVRHRVRKLQEWALESKRGTLVVSNHSTHAMPREDYDLIIWAINRVLNSVEGK